MVWGMIQPTGFGKFWPDGSLEHDPVTGQSGWFPRLAKYYKEQMSEEQKKLFEDGRGNGILRYQTFPGQKFRNELGIKPDADSVVITPIEPHEPPQTYETRPYKSFGSLIQLSGFGYAVDEDLKAIIERLEQGVHQFFPIKIIIGPNDKQPPKKYYTIRIGQFFSSYLPDASDRTKANFTGRAFSKGVFGRAHLWKERDIPAITCLSDELKAEIDAAGLSIPKHYKMKEV